MSTSSPSFESLIAAASGERLDRFLVGAFPDYSRSYFQKLIDQNLVLVNGNIEKKRYLVSEGDEIDVEFALTQEISIEPEDIPLDILYEDEVMLAINKPPGMVVHPAHGNWSHTFVNALLYHCQTLNNQGLRPGIVHRLDKDTSGVLLAAKTERAHQNLVASFAQRDVHKTYLAITVGNPKEQTIEAPIGRHPKRRKEMCVLEGGKSAITHVKSLKHRENLALVELTPITGRTHQIRVHLRSINTPILGDTLYGNPALNKKYGVARQMLHAQKIELEHPLLGTTLTIEAPIPPDMEQIKL